MIKKRKEVNRLIYLVLVLAAGAWVYYSLSTMQEKLNKEGVIRLEDAIERAAVSCYSMEGMYPASVDYLQEHYGLYIDSDKYHVSYESMGANLKPEIKVYQR